jgi:ribulose-5-phosphate 4-epimerase/fuculose-1-phosphate aldolase
VIPAVSYPPGRPPATSQDAIRQVKLACRILARHGQEDLTLGHASVRGPDGGTIWIKRKGRALRDVRKKDVIGIALDDPDGHLTPGAHLETIMHLETYRARPDVGAVIHTHPVHSIALGATTGGLELLSHDGLLFPDGAPVFDGTAGLVTTPRDGQGVARALGGGRAVLLRNHGILAAGPDISWAVLTALTLERGRPGSSSSPAPSARPCRSRARPPGNCRSASTARSSPKSTGKTGAPC